MFSRQPIHRWKIALAAALPVLVAVNPASAINVLFYGNSFTLGQGSTKNVPRLVKEIAFAAGQGIPNTINAAVSGQDFTFHLSSNLGVINSALPAGVEWDYVVMQNFSTAPTRLGNLAQHRTDSVALYQAVATHSPNVTAILFETWARGPGHSFYLGATPNFPGGPSEMQAEVRLGYNLARDDINAAAGAGTARVAVVGDAWENANWDRLHASDIYHAQNRGTLLASLEIYQAIYQDPTTSDIDLTNVLIGLNLTPADGAQLTAVADATPVPEPASLGLVALSGLLIAVRRHLA